MIKSMTGFGTADGAVGDSRVTVEIRSVNHRFFNPTLKLPSEFSRWEGEVRESLRRSVGRGHVTLFARIDREQRVVGAAIDEARFAEYVEQVRALQSRHGLAESLDASTILRLPEVITTRGETEASGTSAELLAIVEQAAQALDAMREGEGARLGTYLRERLAIVEQAVSRIDARAPARLVEQRDRLRANVQELAAGVTIDPQRIAQEIAFLADKLDVSEEVSRFHSHFIAFRQALDGPASDGVGKKLGFLLQELLREANTTGSKANDAAMLADVIAIKEELEKIREQVENLE
ncbi:MAG: hypothetical protein JWO05_3228 [Gemmatimonadetes bacterium]|nr:hypothetical protein [Gemmatimonadota bacterium]